MKSDRLGRSNMNTCHLKVRLLFTGDESDKLEEVCSALKWKYNFPSEESFLLKLKTAINNIRRCKIGRDQALCISLNLNHERQENFLARC